MKTQLSIDNMKCGGCANSVKKGLQSFPEVGEVKVDLEKGEVEVEYNDAFPLEKIKEKLLSMGYPEKGSLEGFDKFTTNAKSFVSCAIGRMTKEN